MSIFKRNRPVRDIPESQDKDVISVGDKYRLISTDSKIEIVALFYNKKKKYVAYKLDNDGDNHGYYEEYNTMLTMFRHYSWDKCK